MGDAMIMHGCVIRRIVRPDKSLNSSVESTKSKTISH